VLSDDVLERLRAALAGCAVLSAADVQAAVDELVELRAQSNGRIGRGSRGSRALDRDVAAEALEELNAAANLYNRLAPDAPKE